ncbi:nucleoside phosphorylase [Chitinophaga ginsengisegetis]|uniref:nucleoside phosphorylase n=1 Tax=Chitinophaga ginsengisegetis TaxID=393003 RepID=UPI000DBA3DDA|nr:nucleoside phosphorylase [Chitinophaga ginsengisegetis]MDR6569920.1 uridine phosphorylase [Chitinophaga ginsengisegetis]MDR6649653.1 uridine phosphorylase [Chitinophaga ginsengisegetis]MDR6656144.1 uridine phosphorylase [Chitinophaga ginsengisegetis]
MDNRIAASELIINNRGAIYHLDVRPDELAHTIITVGDPDRVGEVSKHFDKIEGKYQHREFVTHTGYIGNKRLSVVSTGIGTDNIDIVLNELDALVNIDFETRQVKPTLTSLQVIRLGTSGALQENIPVDSFVVSSHGLGLDNLMNYYVFENTSAEKQLLESFRGQVFLQPGGANPCLFEASAKLQEHFTDGFHTGITVTCPGFYAPQGRVLRGALSNPDLIDKLTSFNYEHHRITNFEMETSGIYGMGRVLGHECLSISAIVANRIRQEFSKDGGAAVAAMIEKGLGIIAAI